MKDKFKLPAYTAMASTFLSINSHVDGKAVYVDIDPDTIIYTAFGVDNFYIDFNLDTMSDVYFDNEGFSNTTSYGNLFYFQHIVAGGLFPYGLVGSVTFFYAGSFLGSQALLKQFSEGDTINNDIVFGGGGWNLMYHYSQLSFPFITWQGGYWYPEFYDGYVGVKLNFFEGGEFKTHYGWIRCSVLDGGNELVIKDYAYELLPDVPIIAGDTVGRIVEFAHDTIPHIGTGLPATEFALDNASIYSFESAIYISVPGMHESISVNIYNISSEIVYNSTMNNEFLTIEMTQPSGVYLVELIVDKQRISRKIILD